MLISEAAAQVSSPAYWLCKAHEVHRILELRDQTQCGGVSNIPASNCGCPGGGTGVTGRYCSTAEDVCTEWVPSDAFVVADVRPAPAEAGELYAWGFVAVIAPVLIMWLGSVVIRGIRRFFGG